MKLFPFYQFKKSLDVCIHWQMFYIVKSFKLWFDYKNTFIPLSNFDILDLNGSKPNRWMICMRIKKLSSKIKKCIHKFVLILLQRVTCCYKFYGPLPLNMLFPCHCQHYICTKLVTKHICWPTHCNKQVFHN